MDDISIRIEGRAGRITLQRPDALNALTHEMCLAIEAALDEWRADAHVAVIVLDAEGERAFCAGGDIAQMYRTGLEGDFGFGQRFWADEYRMNHKIFHYPKPVVSFLHGFTMGGGVGLGCHGSHRVVGESSKIAMPECGIGLVPDVGGSLMLALAPGRCGEYLGLTGASMGPADAIYAGFADTYIPQSEWAGLISALCTDADPDVLQGHAAPEGRLQALQHDIDKHFAGEWLGDIKTTLQSDDSDFAKSARKALARGAPLSQAVTMEILHRLRGPSITLEKALDLEFRFTTRSMEFGDFLEGIRAQIIDKDRRPKWQFANTDVPPQKVSQMLLPQKAVELRLEMTRDHPDDTTSKQGGQMKIGFIGMGNMGGPMAANLAKAGHAVTGFDVVAQSPEVVAAAGSAAQAAADADIVITMLPNGEILRRVAGQIIPEMKAGTTFIDCSTVDVESARAVAAQAAEKGLHAVDAPVSGGIGGAAAGTLTFMAGGSGPAFETALPLFEIMGQKAVHCGDAGAGQAAKICNNMILGATMIATCEAFALADKLGLDRQKMFDVVSTSSGYSWTMNAYCPAPGVGPQSPADNGYRPGFAAELMLKDLGLSQQAAEAVDADTPMGQRALELYRQFVENENGLGQDFSAMLPRFAARGRDDQ